MKYIDAEKLLVKIKGLQCEQGFEDGEAERGYQSAIKNILNIIDSLQQEQPEPYFYCKYGGVIPLCSDCKRNHRNSSFKTEEIITWFVPSMSSKHCINYIQQEQSKIDYNKFEKLFNDFCERHKGHHITSHDACMWFWELGLNVRKEEAK